MRRRTPLMTLTLAGALLAFASPRALLAQTVKEPLLSGDEVHKLVDSGQYKDALKAIARILPLTGPAAAGYDHDDLMMQKAECQFQLHEISGAMATLAQLKKDAATNIKPDDVLKAAAFAELIQKSPAGIYTAKTAANKAAYKILDRAERKNAYDALFADDFAFFQTKATAAKNSGKLPPLLEAAKAAYAARAAEFVSTGNNDQTRDATKELGDRALKLLNDTIDQMASQQSRIDENANRIITETASIGGTQGYYSHARGLTNDDRNALTNIINTCTKMAPAANELGQAFVNQEDAFKATTARAGELAKKADTTLKADYSGLNSPRNVR